MVPRLLNDAYCETGSQILWEDGERVFRRSWRQDDDGERRTDCLPFTAIEFNCSKLS